MSTTTTPATPAIFGQAETFLATIPARRAEIERLRVKERLADTELFNAKRTLLQATSAVQLAGTDDPQLDEHKHFVAQASEAVAQAHNNLQAARLAICTTEAALHKEDGRNLLEPLRAAVTDHQSAECEKFLKEYAPVAAAFQQVLQRGHALADALGIRLDGTPPANASAPIKALTAALLTMPDSSGWADNKQAQTIFTANKSPSLLLKNLEQHIAISKHWRDARYAPSNSRGGFDSAGAFLVLTALRFREVDFPRGSYLTLAALDPTGSKDGIAALKRLVTNGQIQMFAGELEQQATA